MMQKQCVSGFKNKPQDILLLVNYVIGFASFRLALGYFVLFCF